MTLVVGLSFWGVLFSAHRLSVKELRYQPEGQNDEIGSHPLLLPKPAFTGSINVYMRVKTGWLAPQSLFVLADDCIDELSINGNTVETDQIPYCDYTARKMLDVKGLLQSGENIITLKMRNTGGEAALRIKPAVNDLRGWIVRLVFILTVLLAAGLFAWKEPSLRKTVLVGLAILFLSLLRLEYGIYTPYGVRGHDTDAHIDYIHYVAEHWSIPPANDGWEYHQPPLYYAAGAAVFSSSKYFGFSDAQALENVKWLSVLLSLISIFLLWHLSLRLFPKKTDALLRAFFLLLSASVPSFIFLTTRIGNDVLFMPLALGLLLLLLRTWETKSIRLWYASCALFALAFITKNTALVFAPLMLLCLFRVSKRWKILLTALWSFLIVVMIAGWVPAMRFMDNEGVEKTLTMGNNGMDDGLKVDISAKNLLTFNPLAFLDHPFNSPWKDEERRQFFWEYLFRSAFFGEFGFGDGMKRFAQLMLVFGILTIPITLAGIFRRLKGIDIPVLTFLLSLFLASLCYRLLFSYSANQDFRFIAVASAPLAYFMIRGAERIPAAGRPVAIGVLCAFGVLNCIFIAAITL